jgi:hypothetical protein
MYVWELVSDRLRADGWDVWHSTEQGGGSDGPTYSVRLSRPGYDWVVSGLTLTEAYAAAARRARAHGFTAAPRALSTPHLFRGAHAGRG